MTTISDMTDAFARHHRALNRAESYVRKETRNLERFAAMLESRFGVVTCDRLRRQHVQAWQAHLAACRTQKGLPLKPSTVNRRITVVKLFLRFLHRRGYVPPTLQDAIEYVKEPRDLPTSVLEHAELRRLFGRIDTTTPVGYRDRTILELLYTSGVRRAELLGLRLRDLDMSNRTARVTGKGDKQRVVPIGRTALRFLQTYLAAIRPFWLKANTVDALFLNRRGQPLGETGLYWIVKQACVDASVSVSPHTFRRSCTTELIRGNANLYHVKQLLGHESLATLKPYVKLTIADLKRTHAKCHPRERDEKRERG